MTTSRLALLLAILLAGLSCTFLLPDQSKFRQPTGIDLELPKAVGGTWFGTDQEISSKERVVLGETTEFSRKEYKNARGRLPDSGDRIQASVVLSGADMNTSIHRPEWCLPAQGWTIENSSKVPIIIPDRGKLVATRLKNMRFIPDKETGKPITDKDGNKLIVRNLDYYWFVGYNTTTESHTTRNLIDITDRLRHGYNQRWAFVTVAANITENLQRDGLDEKETDEMILEFIKKVVPLTHKDSVKFQ
ncbi:MAG: exosortase-associated EpsI family protein [Chthoniobacteraceae bacterium]